MLHLIHTVVFFLKKKLSLFSDTKRLRIMRLRVVAEETVKVLLYVVQQRSVSVGTQRHYNIY